MSDQAKLQISLLVAIALIALFTIGAGTVNPVPEGVLRIIETVEVGLIGALGGHVVGSTKNKGEST